MPHGFNFGIGLLFQHPLPLYRRPSCYWVKMSWPSKPWLLFSSQLSVNLLCIYLPSTFIFATAPIGCHCVCCAPQSQRQFLSDPWIPLIHAYMPVATNNTFSMWLVLVFSIVHSCIDETSKIINLDWHLADFLKNFDKKIQMSKTGLSNF